MRNSSSNISNVDKIYSLNILTNKGTKTINSIVSNSSKNDNYSWIELDCFLDHGPFYLIRLSRGILICFFLY